MELNLRKLPQREVLTIAYHEYSSLIPILTVLNRQIFCLCRFRLGRYQRYPSCLYHKTALLCSKLKQSRLTQSQAIPSQDLLYYRIGKDTSLYRKYRHSYHFPAGLFHCLALSFNTAKKTRFYPTYIQDHRSYTTRRGEARLMAASECRRAVSHPPLTPLAL